MNSAVMSDRQIEGYNIGESGLKRKFLTALGLAFCFYGAVHLHDAAVAMFINESTGLLKSIGIRGASIALAFFEIVVGGVFVYFWRMAEGKVTAPLLFVSFVGLLLIAVQTGAGYVSIQTKADTRSNKIMEHDGKLSGIQTRLDGLESKLDLDLLKAESLEGTERAIAESEAEIRYNRNKSSLQRQRSGMHGKRPTEAIKNGTTLHTVVVLGFSFFCSMGAMFMSGYVAAFVSPLVAIPVIRFMNKMDHGWDSTDSDYKAVQHRVSPLLGFMNSGGGVRGLLGGLLLSWFGGGKHYSSDNDAGRSVPDGRRESDYTSGSVADNDGFNHSSDVKKAAPENVAKKSKINRPHVDNTGKQPKNAAPVRTGEEGEDNAGYRDFTLSDYERIKAGVISGEFMPTVRPIKYDYLQAKKVCVSDTVRQEKASWCLDKMFKEGVLILNDKPAKGGKIPAKYLLNPDYSKEGDVPEKFVGDPVPEWVSDAVGFEHDGVPVYALEDEEAYHVAVLSPDKSYCLYELSAEGEAEAADIINQAGGKFQSALGIYRKLAGVK